MLSIQLLRLMAEERERDIQKELRVRRLLAPSDDSESAGVNAPRARYRDAWRATTPRASVRTR
jgi:hypothetical protein